ncbi:MAG: UDP-N-acetylmuramate dehydrogenase [Alphaproteobacteria bacterium]|nr:UDP-N-acetylmuramate dehydrogenase [Alphaproteobacteria bacterium]
MTMKSTSYTGLRGAIIENAPIGAQSWFRCGGNADLLFKPNDPADLAVFLRQHPASQPLTIIGGLANTIVRDGGIRGATIQLGKEFSDIEIIGRDKIRASCGALNGSLAAAAVKAEIGGFECLSGIPGSLGGALRMNAGAYGADISDILVAITAVDYAGNEYCLIPRGQPHGAVALSPAAETMEINLSYRNNDAPHYLIFTSAILKGKAEDYDTVKSRITDIKAKRNETQPIKEQTGGSTFANPNPSLLQLAGLPEDTRAWQIVEKVGGRGLMIGGAKMSEKHCNFMINTGNATANDLEMLGEEIRTRAYNDLNIDLHWEIKRIGERI